MKKEYSMLQLIKLTKSTKDELDALYVKYINPASNARSMVSLYNEQSGRTINGSYEKEVSDEICSIDNLIRTTMLKYDFFNSIREEVNSTHTITIRAPNCSDSKVTVTKALSLISDRVKKYTLEYYNKLEQDYITALHAQSAYTHNVMADDKVSTYVNAKMSNMDSKNMASATYGSIADEYVSANKMDILDPLKIGSNISTKIKEFKEKCDSIQTAIDEFNVSTKIWIDIDKFSWWEQ